MKTAIHRSVATLALVVLLAATARADLSLDPDFGGDGVVTLDAGPGEDLLTDVAVQADGKYVASGFIRQDRGFGLIPNPVVVRFNEDGTPDTTFGTNGDGVVVLTPEPVNVDTTGGGAFTVDIQGNDQKIVVGGSWNSGSGSGSRMLVARLNSDGSLDDDADGDPGVVFGTGGFAFLDDPAVAPGFIGDTTIQPDGRILVAGSGSSPTRGFVLRLNDDGSLDTGFASGGSYRLDENGSRILKLAIQTDDAIVAVGGPNDLVAVRLDADGLLDEGFGTNGLVRLNFFADFNGVVIDSSTEDARSVLIQPDGRILVAGALARRLIPGLPTYRAMVVRLTATGQLDDSFGSGGLTLLPTTEGTPVGIGFVLRTSGDMVLAGFDLPPTQVSADGTGFSILAGAPDGDFQGLARLGDGSVVGVGENPVEGENSELLAIRATATDLPDPADDTVPDPFDLEDLTDQPRNTLVVSNEITVSGINVPVPVTVTGGEYSVGCDPEGFTSSPGTVSEGDTVCVRQTTGGNFLFVTAARLDVGGFLESWNVTTEASDTEPDAFTFATKEDVPVSTLVESDPATITGINTAAAIAVSGGEYSVDCTGTYTSAAGTINDGDTLCLRHTSAAGQSSLVVTTVTIGSPLTGQGSATFTSVTTGPDIIPDAFAFVDQVDVPLASTIEAAPVTITGIAGAAPVSISNGQYSVGCTGSWTSLAGTVNNDQQICVRHQSASAGLTAVDTQLTVGGVSDIFTSTTRVADQEPDPFSFADQTDVPLSTLIVSAPVTITGIEGPVPVSVAGGEYSLNCTATYTSAPGTVSNGGTICVRHTSGNLGSQTVETTLTVGGVSDTFSSTTLDVDAVPDLFTFVDQTDVDILATITSAPVTITGIGSGIPVSVTGGTFSVGCGTTYGTTGTVNNGQTVCVRHVSAGAGLASTNTTLTIGGQSDTFTSTTRNADQAPDIFTIPAVTNADRGVFVESAAVTITGIDASTPVSVAGGQFSVGCTGTWTAQPGRVEPGGTVCVRLVSANTDSTTSTATLTVGGVQGSFAVTTGDTTPELFNFVDQADVPLSATTTSAPVTITGITARASISIQAGEYSVGCDGSWTSAAGGLIANGESLCVRHVSSVRRGTDINTVVTVGGVSDTFTSTTTTDKPLPGASAFDWLSLLLLSPVLLGRRFRSA